MATEILIWLIPLPPIIAFILIVLFTNKWKGISHSLALTGAGLSWLASMVVFILAVRTPDLAEHPFTSSINWLATGDHYLKIGVQVDPLTAIMLFFVAWTVLMIFIYSVGYHNYGQPKGDHDQPGLPPHGAEINEKGKKHTVPSVEPMYSRFFAEISLFAFAMFVLVISNNLLTLYIGWEIMGLCSYLLIGFWYGKESARDAAKKAFLTTRIGDVFMLLGLAALYTITGSLDYQVVLSANVLSTLAATTSPVLGLSWSGLIGLLIFIGTIGKSAQFPLHIWLPDAMEGPTPVSAMIHAATMVSAGVYLVIRFFPLISAGWVPGEPLNSTMTIMATIGAFTALFAATIAVAQRDVKRVLAYSTISQLGYMIAALGIGAYTAASFHLLTHAFFKALLFLGSGSVIHGMEHGVMHTGEHVDPQDMFNMGGLAKKMPVTFATFLIGGLALSGFPLITAGFWSKDEILSGAFTSDHLVVFILLAIAALLTAFYTARQFSLVFLGKPRTQAAAHAQETPWTMTLPLVVLSVFAISAGWAGIPEEFPVLGGVIPNWFGSFVGSMVHSVHAESANHSLVPLFTSLVVALGGLFVGWQIYKSVAANQDDPIKKWLGKLYPVLQNKYYVDEIYAKVFIKPSIWVSESFSYLFVDKKLIDGLLHGIARLGIWLGQFLRFKFDLPVINGGGNQIGNSAQRIGSDLKVIQSGRIQQYMVTAVAAIVVIGLIFYYVFVLA